MIGVEVDTPETSTLSLLKRVTNSNTCATRMTQRNLRQSRWILLSSICIYPPSFFRSGAIVLESVTVLPPARCFRITATSAGCVNHESSVVSDAHGIAGFSVRRFHADTLPKNPFNLEQTLTPDLFLDFSIYKDNQVIIKQG